MDYFSELLESYTKLKKRTFKLVYLAEQEEQAVSQEVASDGATEALSFLQGKLKEVIGIGKDDRKPFPLPYPDENGNERSIELWTAGVTEAPQTQPLASSRTPEEAADQDKLKYKRDPSLQPLSHRGRELGEAVEGEAVEGGEGVAAAPQYIHAISGRQFGAVALIAGGTVTWNPEFVGKQSLYTDFIKKFVSTENKDPKDRTPEETTQISVQASEEAVEAARLAKLEPGGLFSAPEYVERFTPDELKEYESLEQQLAEQVDELCKNGVFKERGARGDDKICQGEDGPRSYIGGNFKQSIERALTAGGAITTVYDLDTGNEYTVAKEFDKDNHPDLIAGVLHSHADLLTVLATEITNDNRKAMCNYVKQRIATHKKVKKQQKIVVYADPEETGTPFETGVVMKPNALHKAILKKFHDCDIQQAIYQGNTNRRNEDKGRFNEAIFQFGIEFANAAKIEDDSKRQKEFDEIGQRLKKVVQRSLRKLLDLADSTVFDEDNAIELESFTRLQEIYDQVDIYSDIGKLHKYVKNILEKNLAALQEIDAAGSVPFGTRQALGQKTDTLLYFDGADQATNAAASLGLRSDEVLFKTGEEIIQSLGGTFGEDGFIAPKPPPNAPAGWISDAQVVHDRLMASTNGDLTAPIPVINVGQKVSEGGQIRLGQLAMFRSFLAGQGLDIDKINEEGGSAFPLDSREYTRRLKGAEGVDAEINPKTGEEISPALPDHSGYDITADIIDPKTGAKISEEVSFNEYSEKLSEIYITANRLGNADSTFYSRGADGKIVPMTAEAITNNVANQLKDLLPVGGGGELGPFVKSVIASIVTKDANGNPTQVDLSVKKNRKKLQESLRRDWISSRMGKDLDPKKKGGKPVTKMTATQTKNKRNATLFMVRTAQMLVMNMEEMTQLVVEETGETFSFDQNDMVKQMCAACKAGEVEVTPSRSGTFLVKFEMEGADEITRPIEISIGAERSSGNPVWTANISAKHAQEVGKQLSETKPKPKPENASMMYQYLKGQHQLLETLLNQTT